VPKDVIPPVLQHSRASHQNLVTVGTDEKGKVPPLSSTGSNSPMYDLSELDSLPVAQLREMRNLLNKKIKIAVKRETTEEAKQTKEAKEIRK